MTRRRWFEDAVDRDRVARSLVVTLCLPLFVKQIHLDGRISKKTEEWPERLRVRQWPQ